MCAGFVVCNYVIRKHCDIATGVRQFDKAMGTTGLKKHSDYHLKKGNVICRMGNIEDSYKAKVRDAAARCAVLDTLPFTFTSKPGMIEFTKAVLEVGQCLPPDVQFNVRDLLPSNVTIKNAVSRMARSFRGDLSKDAKKLAGVGGAITTDGMTLQSTGDKYYDFNVHYFNVTKTSFATAPSTKLMVRLLFLKRHNGSSTATALRTLFDDCVKENLGIELDELTARMTWVTDGASNMAATAGATTSKKFELTEKWMACIVHQLNNVMRHAIETPDEKHKTARDDITSVKNIVRIFKQSGIANQLPIGQRLIQAAETRFGTYFTVAERFISSSSEVASILESEDKKKALEYFNSLTTAPVEDGKATSFTALNAIIKCFQPIRQMQKVMETTTRPILHHLLPQLQSLKTKLYFMANSVATGPSPPTDEVTKSLAAQTYKELVNIRIHGLWISACILHPGLRSFSFMASPACVAEWKSIGNAMIRRMMHTYNDDSEESSHKNSLNENSTPIISLSTSDFSLKNAMSFLDTKQNSSDELSAYLSETITNSMASRIRDHDDIIGFWESKWNDYPTLAKVALRVYATPASSSESERDFSKVKRLIGTDRTLLAEDTISDIACVDSYIKNMN